ncbi:hypothetical protein M514_17640 [Trichuris suis]|uniref:Uncharacterized protein n=1 Tax=Trichuris suis TaxID=68888 RepID=A0A085NLE4_9BILA|nr:hypothetical protein M514_17640 [Trichuris suis]
MALMAHKGRERNRDISACDQLASHHLVALLGSVPAHHFIFISEFSYPFLDVEFSISEFSYPVLDAEFLKRSFHLISFLGSSSVHLIEEFLELYFQFTQACQLYVSSYHSMICVHRTVVTSTEGKLSEGLIDFRPVIFVRAAIIAYMYKHHPM